MTQPEYEKRIEDMVKIEFPCDCGTSDDPEYEHERECASWNRPAIVALLLKQRREVIDEELSRGTFSCPKCGLDKPHSLEDHKISGLPMSVYGIASMDRNFLVWVGSDRLKAFAMADFSRDVIEYKRASDALGGSDD